MCYGDDVTCPEFEAHFEKFRGEIDAERRAFLKSAFYTSGAAAATAAGGMSLVTPDVARAAARQQKAQPGYHYLAANADTVHWGYFSKDLTPRVEVDSGDIVTIEALTHHAGDDTDRMVKGDPGLESVYRWTSEEKAVKRRGAGSMDADVGAGGGLGVHICTGPVYVRGAEPGDILEVRILDIKPRGSGNPEFAGRAFGSNAAAWWGFQYGDLVTEPREREVITIYEIDATGARNWARAVYNYRWTPQTDPDGVTHETIDYPGVPVDHTTIEKNPGILQGVRVPIRPHFGVIGLAPDADGLVNSIPPSGFGGNIDNWRIGKGATMYYPVSVDGAMLSVGDPHASQGDSELCGTAIECSLTGTFQVILHKKKDLTGTPLEPVDFPMLETQDDWLVHGFSYPDYLSDLGSDAQSEIFNKSSIDRAMRDAFHKARKFLMMSKGLTEDEAVSLLTVACDFSITQVVDGNWGVHGVIKKDLFSGAES
jgi:acetamidase/formamidase